MDSMAFWVGLFLAGAYYWYAFMRPARAETKKFKMQAFSGVEEALAGQHDLDYGGQFNRAIVGESHYQNQLSAIAGALPLGWRHVTALVTQETGNPHDANAVAVSIGGLTVGYLSRHDAPAFRKAARCHQWARPSLTCPAVLYGGTSDKPSIGVWLDLPDF